MSDMKLPPPEHTQLKMRAAKLPPPLENVAVSLR